MMNREVNMNKLEIELKDKKDFVSKYNSNRISSDLYNYLKDEIKLTNIKENTKIEIIPQFKLSDEEKELLALNIKKTCKEEIDDIKYLEERILLKELLLLLIGATIIFLCFLVKNSAFISEIILIIGWLFIWESLYSLIFRRTKNKIIKERLKSIINSDIDFID